VPGLCPRRTPSWAAAAAIRRSSRTSEADRTEGLQIVEWVRARSPSTPVLILTAYGSPDVERMARERGVAAFLHKPTPLPALERLVSDLLGVREQREPG
jgi:DNA-binding NtrC family response regulator